jgi:hypothetical protein
MANQFDLNELARIFTSRGEKVVVVLPGYEPVVILPLKQYDQLVSNQIRTTNPKLSASLKKSVNPVKSAPVQKLEAIDPPAGSLESDDQYFPEPLEPAA